MITYRFFGGIADGVEANISGVFEKETPPTVWVQHDPKERGINALTANIHGYGQPYKLIGGEFYPDESIVDYEVFVNPPAEGIRDIFEYNDRENHSK